MAFHSCSILVQCEARSHDVSIMFIGTTKVIITFGGIVEKKQEPKSPVPAFFLGKTQQNPKNSEKFGKVTKYSDTF